MRLAMGRSGRIALLLLLVVLISAGVLGKPQQASGGSDDYGEGEYDEYNPVDYEPEDYEGMCNILKTENWCHFVVCVFVCTRASIPRCVMSSDLGHSWVIWPKC